jgi:hypothetical protein
MNRTSIGLLALFALLPGWAGAQELQPQRPGQPMSGPEDSTLQTPPPAGSLNAWGIDVLLSDDGVGLGGFYRREFTPDLYGFVNLAISGSKDGRELERYDPFQGQTFVPGKLNRFIVMPLTFGIQRRLFREDIVDNFRPFINAGVGPALILAAPFTDIERGLNNTYTARQVEFFNSLGRASAHYTASAFIGAGANFGSDKGNLMGVNFRYYFTYMFGEGLPSLYDEQTGEVTAMKTGFGGFMITLNVGVMY